MWGNFTCYKLLLERQLCLELISAIPTPGPFQGAVVINSHTGASKHRWASCSYRKCPNGGSTLSCPTLVPPVTRALGKVNLLGYKFEWNVTERTPKAMSLTASAKSLQSCPTLCNPIDGSPPGSPIPGILQARTLEWVAIAFSSA